MIELPKDTLIGNPLYVLTSNEGGSRDLRLKSATGGTYVVQLPNGVKSIRTLSVSIGLRMPPIRLKYEQPTNIYEGRLHIKEERMIPIIPYILYAGAGHTDPAGIDELLEREYLERTTYLDLLSNGFDLPESIRNIHESQQLVYKVTEKGHEKVEVGSLSDGKPREVRREELIALPALGAIPA